MATAHSRRSRNKALENEDAAQLKLGEDFDSKTRDESIMGPLSPSEAKVVLDQLYAVRQETGKPLPDNPVYKKTYDYASTFALFHSADIAQEARNVLLAHEPTLEPFEIAQIVSLCPLEVEEAKSLIPSLAESHKEEEDNDKLQSKLNELATLRRNQVLT